jgi:hypothetical protein
LEETIVLKSFLATNFFSRQPANPNRFLTLNSMKKLTNKDVALGLYRVIEEACAYDHGDLKETVKRIVKTKDGVKVTLENGQVVIYTAKI